MDRDRSVLSRVSIKIGPSLISDDKNRIEVEIFGLRDIHSITSPPAKLCYILIVHAKSRGRSVDQSRTTGRSTTEKEQAMQWLVGFK